MPKAPLKKAVKTIWICDLIRFNQSTAPPDGGAFFYLFIAMSHYQDAVKFREAFEFPSEYKKDAFELQQRLICEEFVEVMEACAAIKSGEQHDAAPRKQDEELLKELADLVFVCYQMAALMKWDLDEAMKRVFASNMSKLGPDEKPVRREDGKILKGSGYQPPTLVDLVS